MSFFIEVPDDNTVILFATIKDTEPFKAYLSNLGGTYCRELETRKGAKLPAWIFDSSKKVEIEKFILENEDTEDGNSVTSFPDIEMLFDEIFRRIESLEKGVSELFEIVDGK